MIRTIILYSVLLICCINNNPLYREALDTHKTIITIALNHNDDNKEKLLSIKNRTDNKIIIKMINKILFNWDQKQAKPLLLYDCHDYLNYMNKLYPMQDKKFEYLLISFKVNKNGRTKNISIIKSNTTKNRETMYIKLVQCTLWLPIVKKGKYVSYDNYIMLYKND